MGVYGGGLNARIGAEGMGAAVTEPGVRPFDMTGRPMRGIIVVAGDALDDEALERWIGRARGYVVALPPKRPRILVPWRACPGRRRIAGSADRQIGEG